MCDKHTLIESGAAQNFVVKLKVNSFVIIYFRFSYYLSISLTRRKKKFHHTLTQRKKNTKFAHAKRAQTIAMIIDEMIVWRTRERESERARANEREREESANQKSANMLPTSRARALPSPLGFFFSNCQKNDEWIREKNSENKREKRQREGRRRASTCWPVGDDWAYRRRRPDRFSADGSFFFLGFVCEFFFSLKSIGSIGLDHFPGFRFGSVIYDFLQRVFCGIWKVEFSKVFCKMKLNFGNKKIWSKKT